MDCGAGNAEFLNFICRTHPVPFRRKGLSFKRAGRSTEEVVYISRIAPDPPAANDLLKAPSKTKARSRPARQPVRILSHGVEKANARPAVNRYRKGLRQRKQLLFIPPRPFPGQNKLSPSFCGSP